VTRIDELLLSLSPQVAYDHVGLGMVSLVDYAIPDIQLDYQPQHNGTRTAGSYAGFDRFGRVIHHPWVDGNYTTHGSSGSVPNIPPIVELDYTYDKASNRLKMLDERPGALQVNRDMVYSYDELDRLAEAVRGVDGGSPAPGSQKWTLDMLGNWSKFFTDGDGDGTYVDANEETRRNHNDVNELTGIDTDASGSADLALTYDNAGNLRQQQLTDGTPDTAYRYTHDLWNRLVKVEHVSDPGGSETVVVKGEYEYYGTHWRSAKELDTDGSVPDQRREQYYSAGWQLVEERVDDGWTSGGGFSADRRLQYLWGIRYIDDIVMHREDHDGDGDFTDGGTLRWWHVTDVQYSTVAVLDDSATIHERIAYDAYGKARHHDDKDVDRDGDFDSTDRGILTTLVPTPFSSVAITSGSYNADCDLNRDGVLNITDVGLIGTSYVSALAPGELSNSTVKNTIGWDGYVFNPEIAAGRSYLVRFRSYDTGLGRWVERDPAIYIDAMNMYMYAISAPTSYSDPSGADITAESDPIGAVLSLLRNMFLGHVRANSTAKACCPQVRLELVIDFDWERSRFRPPGAVVVEKVSGATGLQYIVEHMRRKIDQQECDACYHSVTIATHGGGGSVSIGGDPIGIRQLRRLNNPDAELLPHEVAMQQQLEAFSSMLCPDATVSLLACDVGAVWSREFWKALGGEEKRLHLYTSSGSCAWAPLGTIGLSIETGPIESGALRCPCPEPPPTRNIPKE